MSAKMVGTVFAGRRGSSHGVSFRNVLSNSNTYPYPIFHSREEIVTEPTMKTVVLSVHSQGLNHTTLYADPYHPGVSPTTPIYTTESPLPGLVLPNTVVTCLPQKTTPSVLLFRHRPSAGPENQRILSLSETHYTGPFL